MKPGQVLSVEMSAGTVGARVWPGRYSGTVRAIQQSFPGPLEAGGPRAILTIEIPGLLDLGRGDSVEVELFSTKSEREALRWGA